MGSFKNANPVDKRGQQAGKPQGQADKPQDKPQEPKKLPDEKTDEREDEKPLLRKDGTPKKSRAGRPIIKEAGEWRLTSLDVRQEYYQFYLDNKAAMGITFSSYIDRLIREDLAENQKLYQSITKMLPK